MLTKTELKDKALEYLKQYKNDMETLQSDRELYLRYYFQNKDVYDNPEGRSSVVSSDVFEVVEGLMPSLMDVFWGGTEVVACSPRGPEDEQAAKAMETLLNFQVQTEIDGYRQMHDWFKDALLQKVAWVKYWWEKDEEFVSREYENLNEFELQALQQKEDFIIDKIEEEVEQEAIIDEYGLMVSPEIKTYEVKGREVRTISRPQFQFVPADEIVFDVIAKDVKSSPFIAHKKKVHKSYLTKYGYSTDEVVNMGREWDQSSLTVQRFADLGGSSFWQDTGNKDFVYIYECYFCDYKKDGTKLHKKVTLYGDEVLEVEENTYGRPPFCAVSPVGIPGRLVGRGMAELATDAQDVTTALTRSILDNCYYDLLGMRVINPFRIDPETLISGNRPGGVLLTKDDITPSSAIHECRGNQLPPHVFQMLQYQEQRKENKTGVNKYSQGSDSREVNRTATGIAILSNNAQQRSKQIARNFAETGVKDLFQCLMDMNIKFLEDEVAIRLDQGWQTIDRNAIDGKYDLKIDVGLGTGTKEIKVQQMMQMLNISMPLTQMGVTTPQNLQEMIKTIYELWGYKSAEKYVNTGLDQQMQQQQMMQQQMMMGGQGAGLPQGGVGQAAPPQAGGFMEGAGGGEDTEPRVDPRILAAVQGASAIPLV